MADDPVLPGVLEKAAIRSCGRAYAWCAVALLLGILLSAAPLGQSAQAQFVDVQEDAAAPPPDDAAGDQAAVDVMPADDLRALVAPVALYPDELLALVLPATTNPLQVVEASRFLEKLKADASLQPDPDWDPAIIALLNYPEVITQLNDDLGWTQELGNAVMDQQTAVMEAIQTARAEAADAGYLQTNDQQVVVQSEDNDTIVIESAQPDVIYVPSYDPTVIVEQTYVGYPPPVYSPPYPAYYAPGATFLAGAIVGATFAYAFDWGDNDIDIDCCGHGDIDIDNDINIDRGDINIGSGNTDIKNKFNGDRVNGGGNGGMKWSPEKARAKSGVTRKSNPKPASADIAKSLANAKANPAAKVQSGKSLAQKSQRGATSLQQTKKPKGALTNNANQKHKQKAQLAGQKPGKPLHANQLKQKKGGGAFGNMSSHNKAKAQSARGGKSLKAGGHSKPPRKKRR